MIPKIIHQTWKTENIPAEWVSNQSSWKSYNPQWKYLLWTDIDNENLVKTYFPDLLEWYKNLKYNIQRVDVARTLILYIYGGLYVDLDMICYQPFDNVFRQNDQLLLVESSHAKIPSNMLMASVPNHPFWLEYIELSRKRTAFVFIPAEIYILYSTGPMCLSTACKKTSYHYRVLPSDLFNPNDICKCSSMYLNHSNKDGIYSESTNAGTWHTNQIFIAISKLFLCHKRLLVTTICLVILVTICWFS